MTTYFLRFEHINLLYTAIIIFIITLIIRFKWHSNVRYQYALASTLKTADMHSNHPHKKIGQSIRILVLLLLTFLIGQPQLVDPLSKISVDGLDIMLVLDVSGSMQFQDYDNDQSSRLDVAKKEAIRFVNKRTNDAMGLVIFAKEAVTRCPITVDKKMLTDIINHVQLGIINADATALVTGMICAANRLKLSKATSKIMIVLTDGEPSEGDMIPEIIIKIAHELGIKIYTVGIGSEQDQLFMHPLYGVMQKPKVNADLLTHIATQSGGQFFMAHNAADMRRIYDTIDQLETTKHEVPLFSYYIELMYPVGLIILFLLIIEIILSSLVWFAL